MLETAIDAKTSPAASRLSGCRVLIVEDDYFLAAELATLLRETGATVLGPASTVRQGRRLASELSPDCVLMDVNLRGEHSLALASEIRKRGIAVIFTTGYDSDDLPVHFTGFNCLSKPLDFERLLKLIASQIGRTLQ